MARSRVPDTRYRGIGISSPAPCIEISTSRSPISRYRDIEIPRPGENRTPLSIEHWKGRTTFDSPPTEPAIPPPPPSSQSRCQEPARDDVLGGSAGEPGGGVQDEGVEDPVEVDPVEVGEGVKGEGVEVPVEVAPVEKGGGVKGAGVEVLGEVVEEDRVAAGRESFASQEFFDRNKPGAFGRRAPPPPARPLPSRRRRRRRRRRGLRARRRGGLARHGPRGGGRTIHPRPSQPSSSFAS